MSGHTPGPYFAANDDAVDCPDHRNSGLALIDTGRHEDWPIARLCEWKNVPLLVAAPDMLDALHAAEDVLTKPGFSVEIALGVIRAAINKAEGR